MFMQMEFRTECAPAAGQSKGRSPIKSLDEVIGTHNWILNGDYEQPDWNIAVAIEP